MAATILLPVPPPIVTVKKTESVCAWRTPQTPPVYVGFIGTLEVAYMPTRREARRAAESQASYVTSDRIGAASYRARHAHQIWPAETT